MESEKREDVKDALCEFVRDVVEQNKSGLASEGALAAMAAIAPLVVYAQ